MPSEDDLSSRKADLTQAQRALLEKWKRGEVGPAPAATGIARRAPRQPAPLSFAQERLWLLAQLRPGDPSLNQSVCVTLDGPLKPQALRLSLHELLRRHEILSANVYLEAGEVWQVVTPRPPLELEAVELSGSSEAQRAEAVGRLGTAEAARPFDLGRDRLVRALLLRAAETRHYLLLTTHLIVCDGWSMRLLLRELAELYEAFSAGAASPLPELPVQYLDYAAWERQHLRGAALERNVEYWGRELADGFQLLRLRTDRPRPTRESFQTATLRRDLPPATDEALRDFCGGRGVTPAMVYHAALQALVHAHTGQGSFLIFFASTHRTLPETSNLVGFFTNILALRADLSAEPSFQTLLARSREKLFGAMEHRDVPFQKLVELLRPGRDGNASSPFQVMLTLLGEPRSSGRGTQLRWDSAGVAEETERFDLHLFILDRGDGTWVSLRYKTELFDATTAARLMDDYLSLLSAAVADPALPVARLAAVREGAAAQPTAGALSPRPAVEFGPRDERERRIVEIWRGILNVEEVDVRESFFELGGHSLLAPVLLARLQECFGVELPLKTLLDAPSVEQLARAVGEAGRGEASREAESEAGFDLRSEVYLDEAIRPPSDAPARQTPPRTVLLTGATGFVGAHLLQRILSQTGAHVYCLVRSGGEAEAEQRLRGVLVSYGLWEERFGGRVTAVAGDLAASRLGLGDARYERLNEEVEAVYHCGCWVNFTYPYSALKPTNVLGTRRVLRFAARAQGAPVHLISSTGVFDPAVHAGRQEITERDDLESSHRVSGGYSQSKWVADKLAMAARDRGLPVCIYRPGWIGGHSGTGVCNTTDFVWSLMKGCVQLGAAPRMDLRVQFSAVDYVCAAVVHLAGRESSPGGAFHLPNTGILVWDDLVERLRAAGYRLDTLPYEEWRARVLKGGDDLKGNTLFPFLPILRREAADGVRWDHQTGLKFDRSHALAGLRDLDFECPSVGTLLEKYIAYFTRVGFLAGSMNR